MGVHLWSWVTCSPPEILDWTHVRVRALLGGSGAWGLKPDRPPPFLCAFCPSMNLLLASPARFPFPLTSSSPWMT